MNLIIDNNDGAGGLDYTPAVLRERPLTIRRIRGEWAQCSAGLDVAGSGMSAPLSRARVLVSDSSGAVLFQGFLEQDATALPASANEANVREFAFTAWEQAWLEGSAPSAALQPPTSSTHTFQSGDVDWTLSRTSSDAAAELATDVTLTGEEEPTAYVTELFRGDGSTQTFTLAQKPFQESGSETLLSDNFQAASLDPSLWTRADPGNYLALGSGGLEINGGNGADGVTLLTYVNQVELGGTLVAEATNVTLRPGSDGLLLGFYNGLPTHAACIAGIRVSGVAGAHTLIAVINGVEQPIAYSFAAGHSYALRVRLHCPEMQRVLESYQALADGTLQRFGGGTVDALLNIVVEALDLGLASSTLATVLYQGAISSSPAQATFAPVNSTQVTGSIGAISLTQTGSAWVVSTAADGTQTTRRQGAIGTGADYSLSSSGVLTFDAGRIPQPGELITVTYRRIGKAQARLKDATADQTRLQDALPGLPAWRGKVVKPPARSSADCKSAAQAMLALACSSAAGMSGEITWKRASAVGTDVLTGDTVIVEAGSDQKSLAVQEVSVTDDAASPELLNYKVTFRQSRATSLSFTVSADAGAQPPIAVAPVNALLPTALSGLQVVAATATSLQIDTGTDPPAGGGFEVRGSDANFGSSNVTDLVLNSPVRNFSIPRSAFHERFFVRMYSGALTRQYSSTSAVVLTSLPTS